MAEQKKDYKAKHLVEDRKTMINALVSGVGSFFGQQIAEAKYKLIEINLNETQHPEFRKVYLSPANLSHVMIDKNDLVILITKTSICSTLEITMEEWLRIRSRFGFVEVKPQAKPDEHFFESEIQIPENK